MLASGEVDRPRGILTKDDREFLLGRKNYGNKQSKINRRADIRKRVRNAIFDFEYILNLDELDIDQIFENKEEHEAIQIGAQAALSFFYLGLKYHREDIELPVERASNPDTVHRDFEYRLEEAVKQIEFAKGREVTDFDLEIDTRPARDIKEVYRRFKLEGYDDISYQEFERLLASDEISEEGLAKHLTRHGVEEWDSEMIRKEREGMQQYRNQIKSAHPDHKEE